MGLETLILRNPIRRPVQTARDKELLALAAQRDRLDAEHRRAARLHQAQKAARLLAELRATQHKILAVGKMT